MIITILRDKITHDFVYLFEEYKYKNRKAKMMQTYSFTHTGNENIFYTILNANVEKLTQDKTLYYPVLIFFK